METILKNILTTVAQAPFSEWSEIELYAKLNKGFSSYTGDIIDLEGKRQPLNIRLLPKEFNKLFIRLYEETSNSNIKWNEVTLKMSPEKILEINYIWNQERHDRVEAYNKRFNNPN